MTSPLDNLATAIKDAAQPFALNRDFLVKGLNDPSINVPDDFDSNLNNAFQLGDETALSVTAGTVGAVRDNTFSVTACSYNFFGFDINQGGTLVFSLIDEEDEQSLSVQIATAPGADWGWGDLSPYMTGWLFQELSGISDVLFVFTTTDGDYNWNNTSITIKSVNIQNFAALLSIPKLFDPLIKLIDGLSPPTAALAFTGTLDYSPVDGQKVDGNIILYPATDIRATLVDGGFKLFYLNIESPWAGLKIPAAVKDEGEDGNSTGLVDDEEYQDDDPLYDQSPSLYLGVYLGIKDNSDSTIRYVLEAGLIKGDTTRFNFSIAPSENSALLTPAVAIQLFDNKGNYLEGTPAIIQQFLTAIGLKGLSLSGSMGETKQIDSLGMMIGSDPERPWSVFNDPSNAFDITFNEFDLSWTIDNPFGDGKSSQYLVFMANFALPAANPLYKVLPGNFSVEFTSELQFYAGYDGTVDIGDLISALSAGFIAVPQNIISVQLSGMQMNLDFTSKAYSFNAQVDADLNFLEINGEPILSISGGAMMFQAKTATQQQGGYRLPLSVEQNSDATKNAVLKHNLLMLKEDQTGKTVYSGSFSGLLGIGPLYANTSIAYDGFSTPARWDLSASLAQPLDVSELINQFFDPGGSYPFPNFFPGDLQVLSFAVNAVIPAGEGDLKTSYDIATSFKWLFSFGDNQVGIDPATLTLKYDGAKPQGQQFSGSAIGTWVYTAINLELIMGYEFIPTAEGGNNILFVQWQGFRAEYESGKELITFSLKGWSIGSLIQALVRTLGNPYFTLPSPWDLLNKISLDGLKIMVSLKSNEANRLSASYELSSPINLGFIKIDGLTFRRDTNGKVTLAIEGSSPIAGELGDLMDPKKGQDVEDLPQVPGRGDETFKLFLLVLGQRIGITGYADFNNTKEVITALQNVPNTEGKTNPVDPNADQGSAKGQPYYDQSNNWLIAGHLGLLKVGGFWTVDLMVVFNDPNLYGLRLAMAGPKAGGLSGLSVDILYKKITDDIGVYQIEFTFPDAIRNINFGSVSVVLPDIGIKVYTNGDFFIDIGFPYNLDFTRSFSISAIIYGVPVLGSGGFYIAKLSNATSTNVPKTIAGTDKPITAGTFDPVIEFGLGLQLGLGYNFIKGPLKAGFALTVFGIVEGVIASWNPYNAKSTELALSSNSNALQSDYYFKISGTVGIIGLLYGSVDFAIVKASVNVKITLSLQIVYESYRSIPITAAATVDISVKVKIDLGLFSITIKLSFSARVSASFVVGTDEVNQAPWNQQEKLEGFYARTFNYEGPDAVMRRARLINPRPKRIQREALKSASNPILSIATVPQFTVNAPQGSRNYSDQQGAFVFLMAMDAPDATGDSNANDSSFDLLCKDFFPWIIDALARPQGDTVILAEVMNEIISADDLLDYITRLADTENQAVNISELLQFLKDSFILDIEKPETADQSGLKEKLQKGSVIFPVFDGLSLSVPASDKKQNKPVPFQSYATATTNYRKIVARIFAEVEANIEAQNQEQYTKLDLLQETPESMAALTFVDSFALIGRQLLQAASNALESYPYSLNTKTTIKGIIDWANNVGNQLSIDDVVLPNADHQLSAGIDLTIPELGYTLQSNDSLQDIANQYSDGASPPRWTTTAQQLIISNQTQRILQAGVELQLKGKEDKDITYTTLAGDTFKGIADQLHITIEQLASQGVLYSIKNLLIPTTQLNISGLQYQTAPASEENGSSTDTLNSVAALFSTTVSRLSDSNITVENLFSTQAQDGMITLAKLNALSVNDLWIAVNDTDQVAQTAGMMSRFLMYGLRLPRESGLTLSADFLYPAGQSDYGLYQLTGQQFPTPDTADNYSISLQREDQSHGVDFDFIRFDGTSDKILEISLADAYTRLGYVLDWARAGDFQPAPTLEVLPLSERKAKTFAAATFALWSSADMARLQELTDRQPAGVKTNDEQDAQVQPTLWMLPASLLNLLEKTQASIEAVMGSLADTLPLLPQFQPQLGKTSPAGGQTDYSDLQNWTWSTRVDFEIKRLPKTTAASHIEDPDWPPQGPANAPFLENIYELVGPTAEDALKLQRILTAMDALGEGIASDLFILYNQSGPSNPMLVTPATKEFLSFITQTNLSTETNPPALLKSFFLKSEDNAPRGIANSPAEFIRLMWELSVVRSGGYYLYYEMAESGAGLPASVFDSSATGTISMVVTFQAAGDLSFGNTVPDFINAFLTSDVFDTNHDQIQLSSLAASGTSAPLSGDTDETLNTLSAVYGPGPGRIAESNKMQVLSDKIEVLIKGLVHQLTQSDVSDPSTTLEDLAKYYSVGAKTPIKGSDIAAFNPGVNVELGAVYYIPAFTYVVTAAVAEGRAPGNTFNSMAEYYGVDIDTIARSFSADNTGGLFAKNTVLLIDTQLFDLRSQLGPRNVGISLQRDNLGEPPKLPANPSKEQKADYAKAYMYSLYSILSAGFAGNVYFNTSPMGLPFGPQNHEEDEQSAFASHTQSLQHRKAKLISTAEKPYDYRQSLGFTSTFSRINAAPKPAQEELPPREDNPYLGIGSSAQIALQWQDIFGNTTLTPFEKPDKDYKGALNGSALTILYNDRLIGLAEWPNVQADYRYSNPTSATLVVDLTLDTSAYTDISDKQQIEKALKLYQKIYFQLHQDYTNLDKPAIPGVSGNAVSMVLTNSLMAIPSTDLDDSQAGIIREFASACVIYLQKLLDGTNSEQPRAELSLPIDISGISSGNMIELDVALVFMRQAVLTEPGVAALNDGLQVSATILPKADAGTAAYTEFATSMEQVFHTDSFYLKIGAGLKDNNSDNNNNSQQLWAVRFGKSKGTGIFFEIDKKASYYAPKPVAKSLQSRSADITDYKSGETHSSNFTAVDLNLWFQTCLDAVDSFLSADYAPHAFILDKLQGVDDPLKEGNLGKLLQYKNDLANDISAGVMPVLSNSDSDPSSLYAAREKLRQQLLNQIGAAYSASTVLVFALEDVSGAPDYTPAGPPALYGQPGSTVDDTAKNRNNSLTAAKIPLGPVHEADCIQDVNDNKFDPRLAFVLSSKNIIEQAYIPLNLTLNISHLEFERRCVAGIQGYVQSRWLAFVNDSFDYILGNGASNVPVINRNLPTPPTVTQQQGTKYIRVPEDAADLARWNYGFEYIYQRAAQDAVQNEIELNRSLDAANTAHMTSKGPDLFTSLAQFISSYPDILADFNQYLVKIDAAKPEQQIIDAAAKAVSTFVQQIGDVSRAYHEHFKPELMSKTSPPELVVINFMSLLNKDSEGRARTDILNIHINDIAAKWDRNTRTISNGSITLPAPVVAILPESYTAVPADKIPSTVEIAYLYEEIKKQDASPRGDSEDTVYLQYGKASQESARTVSMNDLDVLAYQNGWSSIYIQRNLVLFPIEEIDKISTNEDFLFQTPVVKFSDAVVPRLLYNSFSLDDMKDSPTELEQQLTEFFQSLYSGGNGTTTVKTTMQGRYSYDITKDLDGIPRVQLPVNLLPPAISDVSPGTTPEFVVPFAQSIKDWRQEKDPTLKGDAQVDIELKVFSNEGAKQPLITVEKLTHKAR